MRRLGMNHGSYPAAIFERTEDRIYPALFVIRNSDLEWE